MSWITFIWSAAAGAGLLLAWIHLLIWWRNRRSWAHLCFFIAVLGVVWLAAGELASMRASTPEGYSRIAQWQHLWTGMAMIACMAFVHFYFGTGRRGLLGAAIGLRVLAVIANFTTGQNLHIRELLSLRTVTFLGEDVSILGDLVLNPWVKLGQLAAVLQFLYVLDASVRLWRRGGWDRRRRVLLVGVSLMGFGIYAMLHGAMMVSGVVRLPMMMSLPFLAVVMGMGYELMRDVLRSARLSAELQASEHRLSLAAEAAQFAIWEWNVLTEEIHVSREGRQLYGVGPHEDFNLGRFNEAVHPDDRSTVATAIKTALAETGRYAVDYRAVLPDGTERWIAASGVVEHTAEGKPRLVRGVSIDITSRKAAEAEAAAHRMELAHLSRVGMLGELAGSIAHELNQPLAAMLSNAQVARRSLEEATPDLTELREILDDIAADAKRAGGIIHGMRAMFKKEALPDPEPVDLREAIAQVISLLHSEIITRKVMVETQPGAGPLLAEAGRVEVQQILLNLLLNALEALTAGGEAGGGRIEITGSWHAGRITVGVRDDGPGIPDAMLPRLFDPFASTKPGGLGLGLAISRGIAQRFGGTLTAWNHPEGGAVFHLSLPAVPGPDNDLPAAPVVPSL